MLGIKVKSLIKKISWVLLTFLLLPLYCEEVIKIVSPTHNYDLDPVTASFNTEAQIITGLYEGLFTYDPITLDPVAAIATNYKVSRDKLRWTFSIRENTLFSNGSLITASAIRSSFISLLKNKNASYASLLDIIKGVKEYRLNEGKEEEIGIEAPDDKTLLITLNKAVPYLPRLLCMPTFSVKSEEEGVYSGAYILEKIDDKECVLLKNVNYYESEKVKIDKIIFTFSDNDKENSYLFNTGEADWITANIDLKSTLDKDASHIMAEAATEFLFFKSRADSVCSNKTLREALLEAAPYDKLRDKVFVPATSFVYPLGQYPKVNGYTYQDLPHAKELIKQAKAELGLEEAAPLVVTMAITGAEHIKKEAELLKEAWEKIGVTLNTIELDSSSYLLKIADTPADIFTYTWIADFTDPMAFLELFRTGSSLNVSGWSISEYDSTLEEAKNFEEAEYYKKLSRAEQILLDASIVLPIQHPVSLNVIDLNAVGGWALNSFDIHPLKYLYKKEVKNTFPNMVKR